KVNFFTSETSQVPFVDWNSEKKFFSLFVQHVHNIMIKNSENIGLFFFVIIRFSVPAFISISSGIIRVSSFISGLLLLILIFISRFFRFFLLWFSSSIIRF